jgi:hypothetical protein
MVWSVLFLPLCFATAVLGAGLIGPLYDGPDLDYQPSILRVQPSGQLLTVIERRNVGASTFDLVASASSDGGQSWSTPQPAISTPLNERHPSLVQTAPNALALFYLVDETGAGAYRIHRATSADGLAWSDQGAINLGWSTPGEINPSVISEAGGALTMTYHRINGPSYLARSLDGGATWDTLKTQVSPGTAALPRVAKRASDGRYIVTYQVSGGSGSLAIYAKVSSDPYSWSAKQVAVATTANSHDSQPIVLENGTFVVFTAEQQGSDAFDLYYRTSQDGARWSKRVRVTNDPTHYDLQPHPILQGTPGHLILTWSHQQSATPYEDHDIWINTDLVIQ